MPRRSRRGRRRRRAHRPPVPKLIGTVVDALGADRDPTSRQRHRSRSWRSSTGVPADVRQSRGRPQSCRRSGSSRVASESRGGLCPQRPYARETRACVDAPVGTPAGRSTSGRQPCAYVASRPSDTDMNPHGSKPWGFRGFGDICGRASRLEPRTSEIGLADGGASSLHLAGPHGGRARRLHLVREARNGSCAAAVSRARTA